MKHLIFSLILIVLVLSSERGIVGSPSGAETSVPEQIQITLREIQVINKPITNGTLHFIITYNDKDNREDIRILNISRVDIGENITVSSPFIDVQSSEFYWKVILTDDSEQLMLFQGWSDFHNAKYENPIFFNQTRLSIPRTGSSLIISVTRVSGFVQFAAELQRTIHGNFTLRYWIDVNGDFKQQTTELITKNLSINSTLLFDNSTFKSLRLETNFDVQLNITNRNIVWFSGRWDFRTNKALFSNSSLSPDLDVVKWAWFYPDPKSIVFEIPLDNEELFHKIKTGTTADSISHGSGVLVGRPTELLNEVIKRLQGKKEISEGSQTPTATPLIQQILSHLSLGPLTPLGVLIMISAVAILSTISAIKVRRYIRKRRVIKTGEG